MLAGKFLQLTWRDREYLIFAPFELHRYHNQILGHFLEDNGIAHRWVDVETLEVKDAELRVIGGGRFRLGHTRKTLDLWDDSQVYGRFDKTGLADRIATADHTWSGFEIGIS